MQINKFVFDPNISFQNFKHIDFKSNCLVLFLEIKFYLNEKSFNLFVVRFIVFANHFITSDEDAQIQILNDTF